MPGRTIAPVLTAWIRSLRPGAIPDDVMRDVRALLAVARVMERQIAEVDRRYPELADGRDVSECRRALARLHAGDEGKRRG